MSGEPTSGKAETRAEIPAEVLDSIRSVCLALPEVYEEEAWTGTRWRVRKRTFAHVLLIESGWPPAYARAAATDGPVCVLMFRSSGMELAVLRDHDHPYFAPAWRADEVGLLLDSALDRDELAGLLTDSFCVVAPRKLAQAVEPRLRD